MKRQLLTLTLAVLVGVASGCSSGPRESVTRPDATEQIDIAPPVERCGFPPDRPENGR